VDSDEESEATMATVAMALPAVLDLLPGW